MKTKGKYLWLAVAVVCVFSLFSGGAALEGDYSDSQLWAYLPETSEHEADVFFIAPTVYYGDDSSFNMPLTDAETMEKFVGAINMEKGIYECCDLYAPYYSQASLSAYELPEEEREAHLELAYEDVKDAFRYYMENYNDGRPLILAGFSQGGDMVLRLMEEFFDSEAYQDKLVAAYALGAAVTEKDLKQYPHLKMAECASDLDCIVSFNSEAPEVSTSIIVPETTLGINPLNWMTDSTPGEAELNKGACFTDYSGQIQEEIEELCGAYLDESRGTLKVTGVTPEDYPPVLSLFEDGVYHLYDYQFFYRNLQENVETRVEQYLTLEKLRDAYTPNTQVNAETEEADIRLSDFVKSAESIEPEMLQPEYWIERCGKSDELLMTQEEIAAFQPLAKESYYSLTDQSAPQTLTAEELGQILSEHVLPEIDCYYKGEPVQQDYWDRLIELEGLESIADENPLRYGVCLNRGSLRILPTDDVLSASPQFTFYDEMQGSSILLNEPVAVLWESKDGAWLYVVTCYAGGWIHRDQIALCSDYSQWREIQDFEDFLVVTGDKLSLDYDPTNSRCSQLEISMGVKLQLVPQSEYKGNGEGRLAAENYIVKIPAADENGNYYGEFAYVPLSEDVSMGYVPYTRANIIDLAFKSLGTRYGWGGMYGSRDCSQYVMELFRCFGIMLPRNATGQTGIPCLSLDMEGMSDENKRELLDAVPPGSLLLFPDHVMIYLGEVDGLDYVISAVAASQSPTGEYTQYQSVMLNELSVLRRSGLSWLQCLTTAKVIWEKAA